mmetsp:Transcript_15255/g.36225  ORF Transcript_15255/g.36225 Transcript_15255/m.36225 type:complete len:825 (+) Transcript_15255:3-2477(+)
MGGVCCKDPEVPEPAPVAIPASSNQSQSEKTKQKIVLDIPEPSMPLSSNLMSVPEESQPNFLSPKTPARRPVRELLETQGTKLQPSSKTAQSLQFLQEVLQNHFMFSEQAPEERARFAESMHTFHTTAGQHLISDGEPSDIFFVVESGEVTLQVDRKTSIKKRGDTFGDMALLCDGEEHTTSAHTTTPGILHALDRATFRKELRAHRFRVPEDIKGFLTGLPLLSRSTPEEVDLLATALVPVAFEPGQEIMRQGDTGALMYFVRAGSVELTQRMTSTQEIRSLGDLQESQWFGEGSLLTPDQPRAATVTAGSEGCVTLAIDTAVFSQHLAPIRGTLLAAYRMRVIKSLPALGNMEDADLLGVIMAMQERAFQHGEVIVKQGQRGDFFYIIKHGLVKIISEMAGRKNHLATLGVGEYFGEFALLDNQPRTASVIADGPVQVYLIARVDFETHIGDYKHLLQMEKEAREEWASIVHDRAQIRMDDLDTIKELGSGSFGHVRLVRHRPTRIFYALKTIRKQDVEKRKLMKFISREKHIHWQLNHDFVLRLHAAFTEPAHLCMLLDFCPGGDLLSRMNKVGGSLPHESCALYAAMLLLALEYIQRLKVVYRDIKPENLLIDDRGYLKLADFGMAKVLSTKARTFTVCGSPEYMAPEMIKGSGHSFTIDNWGLGILIYEMNCGHTPFNPKHNSSSQAVCKRITSCTTLHFDESEKAKRLNGTARDIINRFLRIQPDMRAGGDRAGGWEAVKTHAFFSTVHWEKLVKQELEAPWIPDMPPSPSIRAKQPSSRALQLCPLTPLPALTTTGKVWEQWENPVPRMPAAGAHRE